MAAAASIKMSPTVRDDEVRTVGAYLRVSTEHQEEANQRPDVERLIRARFPNAEIVYYCEKKSAAKQRPVYERMLREANARRFEVLVVWALDRFGRSMTGNLNDVLALDAAGVRVISCLEPWLDTSSPVRPLLIALFSWGAEQERKRIQDRINGGIQRVKEAGGVLGRCGFGLRHVRDKSTKLAHVELDDALRPMLMRMAQFFAESGSLRGTAMRLTAEGAPPPSKGGYWGHCAIKRILRNPDLRRLGAWPPNLLNQVDALLGTSKRHVKGSAKPAHLASSFLACAVCGGALTVAATNTPRAAYVCVLRTAKGKAACPGVGFRSEPVIDKALIEAIRPALDGDIAARALEIVRQQLTARPDVTSEIEAVKHALAEAERGGRELASAIKKGGKLESLVEAARENEDEKKRLRARVARLEAAPAPLDTRRRLKEIERRLSELSKVLDKGGIEARPAVAAVLQGRRLVVTPVPGPNGNRLWRIEGRIPAGYVASIDGSESTTSCSRCSGRCGPSSPRSRRRIGISLGRPGARGRASCSISPRGAGREGAHAGSATAMRSARRASFAGASIRGLRSDTSGRCEARGCAR
jgi:DNA invertase Pin-like site-specific DNA recombinase